MRGDSVAQSLIRAPNRLKHRSRDPFTPAGPVTPGPCERRERSEHSEHLIHARYDRKQDHLAASSATPQATRHAPAQRRESTRSFKTNRARMVSNTMAAAETGTAKLRSA